MYKMSIESGSGSGDKPVKYVASSSIPTFNLRNKEDYPTWKFKMKNYLMHEELWEAVVGYPEGDSTSSERKIKQNIKALTKICLTVDGMAITRVRTAQTAAEAWRALQRAYEDCGMGRKLALERRLYRICLADYTDIEAYINAVLRTAQDLADIGKTIAEEFQKYGTTDEIWLKKITFL